MEKKNNDSYLQVMDTDDICVEEVSDHTIIVDSRKEIDAVSICPMIGGACSIVLTFKEEK